MTYATIESARDAAEAFAHAKAPAETMITEPCDDGTFTVTAADVFVSVGYRFERADERADATVVLDKPGAYRFYAS